MNQPLSPTKHERDIRFANMKLMKQQILDIRQRKQAIPKTSEPMIVKSFNDLYKMKANQIKKKLIERRIQQKQKQYSKIKQELNKYREKYEEKEKLFKQKEHIFRVLTEKLEIQYEKTKLIFKDVAFNKSITLGVKKLSYFRVAEILLNENARRVFSSIENVQYQENSNKYEQEMGICIGYLGLLISIVGQISGARMWFDFVFKGSKSQVKLNDGTYVVMRPKQVRFKQGINIMLQQLYQIMHETMGLKIQRSTNLYQLCEQLCKYIVS